MAWKEKYFPLQQIMTNMLKAFFSLPGIHTQEDTTDLDYDKLELEFDIDEINHDWLVFLPTHYSCFAHTHCS